MDDPISHPSNTLVSGFGIVNKCGGTEALTRAERESSERGPDPGLHDVRRDRGPCSHWHRVLRREAHRLRRPPEWEGWAA